MTLRVLDLFSGIGGFSLGLERTGGFRTVAFCEIDPYCRAVLRKHWPDVPCFSDVRDLHAFDVGPVDVICGGFPCQDISTAGKGAGLAGERSGLWSEYRRLIGECRPAWAIIENVPALRTRGFDQVRADLDEAGYASRTFVVGADDIGAPHKRKRVWIVAYPFSTGLAQRKLLARVSAEAGLTDAWQDASVGRENVSDSDGEQVGRAAEPRSECRQWLSEPDVGRVANGVPSRVDRLRALGNAVVPQIPELIGRAILKCAR